MNIFERFLSVWVLLCIALGVLFGQLFPQVFADLAQMQYAQVNMPVALLIWVMIIPMLMKVDFSSLHQVRQHWRGLTVTLLVNWVIKPCSMALLAWFFIRGVLAGYLPTEQLDSYVAGLILLAAAPCTAMVFVWSRLSQGDALFTLTQVALNDVVMLFAFAPIVGLLLGMSAITVPLETLLTSVLMYIVIPVVIAQLLRVALLRQAASSWQNWLQVLSRFSMAALLLTLILLFAFQGEKILQQPLVILLLAIPITLQVIINASLAYGLNRAVGEPHAIACPSALIGASNFFELAVATAISLFGLQSGAALATVVGVLVEVPLMLLVVKAVNASRAWYQAGLR
jgi:ACR3 family arsenite transporter